MKVKGTVAIIPARGGSKGIPRKNIQDLGGQPLLAWPIAIARKIPEIERVIVTTDDAEIAETAKQYGAEVIMRPARLSQDAVPTYPVLIHALRQLAKAGYRPDNVVLLYSTSPFLNPARIREGLRLLGSGGTKSVVGVREIKGKIWATKTRGGKYFPIHPKEALNRQYFCPWLHEAGNIYITKSDVLMQSGRLIDTQHCKFIKVEEDECLDIDNTQDLQDARARVKKERMKSAKTTEFIPYNKASISQAEIDAVTQVLKSGWLTMGNKTVEFEEKFSKFIGVKHAISVNSCTAALQLALMAHEIGPGDEVLVPSLTFVATANVVVHVGAKPVFVDVDPKSLCMSADDLKRKITKRTKAIIPVHYGGQPADLSAIAKIAAAHKLAIIEDAAHAVGSEWHGKKIGRHGNTVCFSFYATKNLTTGEGGMLTTNDANIADFVRRNRLHGISKDAWKRYQPGGKWQYDVLSVGLKCNLTDMQSAIGIEQLRRLPKFTKKRIMLADYYDKLLSKVGGVNIFPIVGKSVNSRHLYVIALEKYDRDKFINQMADHMIGTSVHFIPIHTFTYYREHFPVPKGSLPATEAIASKLVSLPLYPEMDKPQVLRVVRAIQDILGGAHE